MSKRIAAQFGGGVGGSGSGGGHQGPGGGSGTINTKAKKFCTQGEEFFGSLKALGYQPPKHQQHEHFEYLFQDDKGNSFAKKLMSTLKIQNCLSAEEIERFETLKSQGAVLYGTQLEEAVARKHSINEMYSQQRYKRLARKEDLEKELKVKEKEAEQLELLQLTFLEGNNEWTMKEAKILLITETVERLLKQNEKSIEIDFELLNEKMGELEQSVIQLKKELSLDHPKSAYICQINGRRLLENEEKLFEMVKEMTKKHGTNLIMKEAGYGVESDPLSTENINKVYTQYEKDFERLKHCIIYEKVKQLSLEQEYAGALGVTEGLQECVKRAHQLSEFDDEGRTQLQEEAKKATTDLFTTLSNEQKRLEDHARETTLVAVNKQFSALTNIKTRFKKKLQEFFTTVINVLKEQKVRMSLVRNLVKAEAKLYAKLLTNIEENIAVSQRHSERLTKEKLMAQFSDLTQEGQIVYRLLQHFGIEKPVHIINSTPNTIAFVRKSISDIQKLYWSQMDEKQNEFNTETRHLEKTHEVLKEICRNVAVTNSSASSDLLEFGNTLPLGLKGAENYTKKLEEKLNFTVHNQRALAKESKKLREESMRKARELLVLYENE